MNVAGNAMAATVELSSCQALRSRLILWALALNHKSCSSHGSGKTLVVS
jgi:hypothetical protein